MYLGLGMLKKRTKLPFEGYSDDFIRIPRRVGGHEIVKNFKNVEEFCKHLYPTMETTADIPEAIVLTPKNKNMFLINDQCLTRFRPDIERIPLKSYDTTYVPEHGRLFTTEMMNNYNPGGLPRHEIQVKPGCSLMLLRNLNLMEGLANGTRLRLLSVHKDRKVMQVEVLTGPKANPAFTLKDRTFPLFRIPCTNNTDRYIQMTRKQFPVRLTYAMSINKAQGTSI